MIANKEANTLGGRPPARQAAPEILVLYLKERRRALITELRQIELLLGEQPTVKQRKRPR